MRTQTRLLGTISPMKQFRLSNFEARFDRVILDRGRQYLMDRRVTNIQEGSPGEFTAAVEGSERYLVRVFLATGSMEPADQLVTDISCSCPYDAGPYCKHEAALLFVLRERLPVTPNETDRASRLAAIFARLTRKELEEIILSHAGSDQIFALGLLTEYDADLRLSIRSELKRFTDRWGLIEYRDAFTAAGVFDRLFDQIDSHLTRKAFRPAFDVTTAIIEEAATAITYTDDSAGVMGGVVCRGIEALRSIVEAEIDDDLRHDIVKYVERTVDSDQFPDVADWGLELWRLSTAAVRSEEEYQHLLNALQEALPPEKPESGFARDYVREQLLLLMTQLMERFGDQEQAESIRQENRHLVAFREALLSRAWSEEDFETVIRLAEEGIARDTHSPGLLKQWRFWALEAYRAANRIGEARRTARDLVLAGDAEFLTTYRDLVPSDGWPAAREALIAEVKTTRGYIPRVLPELLVLEELWLRLMELLEQNPYLVTEYGDRLYPRFPGRVRTVWSSHIMRQARSTGDRRGYRRIAESIQHYAGVVGDLAATEVRDAILLEFPRRPAMRDELLKAATPRRPDQ